MPATCAVGSLAASYVQAEILEHKKKVLLSLGSIRLEWFFTAAATFELVEELRDTIDVNGL